ncbi:MAG: DUF5915 domain-containing protein [Acidimicrobiales bacterium]
MRAEGLANDVVRLIQQTRKDLDLQVTDRIDIRWALTAEQSVIERHLATIEEAVLGTFVGSTDPDAEPSGHLLAGEALTFSVRKVDA